MRRLIIILMVVAAMAPSLSLAFQNEPDGFRDLPWGADFASLEGMTAVEARNGDGRTVYATRAGDTLRHMGTEVESILYRFYGGKLSAVTIAFTGKERYKAIAARLLSAHGRATRTSHSITWTGETTRISLRQGPLTFRNSLLTYYHTPYYRRIVDAYLADE